MTTRNKLERAILFMALLVLCAVIVALLIFLIMQLLTFLDWATKETPLKAFVRDNWVIITLMIYLGYNCWKASDKIVKREVRKKQGAKIINDTFKKDNYTGI